MRPIVLVVVCAALVATCGCAPRPPAGAGAPGERILAQGTRTLAPGRYTSVFAGTIRRPGKLTATITWAGPPARLKAFFRRSCPARRGLVTGGSPLVSSVRITAAQVAGGSWRLCVSNPGAAGVTFEYVIRYARR